MVYMVCIYIYYLYTPYIPYVWIYIYTITYPRATETVAMGFCRRPVNGTTIDQVP